MYYWTFYGLVLQIGIFKDFSIEETKSLQKVSIS